MSPSTLRIPRAVKASQLSLAQAREKKLVEENLELRTMCAVSSTGLKGLYHDDGELQDASARPLIDWKRDSVEEIKQKLTQRGLAALANATPSGAEAPGPSMIDKPSKGTPGVGGYIE